MPSRRLSKKRPPIPPILAPREQLRLISMVVMMVLLLNVMRHAKRPENWTWITGEGSHRSGLSTPNSPAQRETGQGRLHPRDSTKSSSRSLPEGVFQSYPPLSHVAPETVPAESFPNRPVGALQWLPGINADLLRTIEDDTVFRAGDARPWQVMVDILREKSAEELTQMSIEKVGFVQLYQQTPTYRGQLVTLRGFVRRCEELTNDPSKARFRWILEPEGGADSPIVIYTLELPEDFPFDRPHLREPVEVTGFCFKRWAYLAGDGSRVAPLLLAKTIPWKSVEVQSPSQTFDLSLLGYLLIGGLVILWGVKTLYLRTFRQRRRIMPTRIQIPDSIADPLPTEAAPLDSEESP